MFLTSKEFTLEQVSSTLDGADFDRHVLGRELVGDSQSAAEHLDECPLSSRGLYPASGAQDKLGAFQPRREPMGSQTEKKCPRDKALMADHKEGDATLDVCGKCGGQFFDSGEMFKAFGIKADPSYWDRPETGGVVTQSELPCAQCAGFMLKQDVKYDGIHVEIDRCGKCGGIWLDKGEADTIMKIGEKLQPILDAERAKAKEELDKMGEADFSSPGLIARFLGMFKKKG